MKPLYGFGYKRCEPVGDITLPISFGTPQNPRIEYIIFDVIDMHYPYNAIFGRGLRNTFKAALHSGYLFLKIPTTFGVISVFESQKDARKNEQGFAPNHKNVHFLREELEQYQQSCPFKVEAPGEFKKAIKVDGDFKKVALDPRVPNRVVCPGTETSTEEQAELLVFLDKNIDVFAWSTSDLVRVSKDIIGHKLQANPNAKPIKQKLQKMSEEKVEAAKAEVQILLNAGFIREVTYPQWLIKCGDGLEKRMENGECVLTSPI
jgi:ubiquitin